MRCGCDYQGSIPLLVAAAAHSVYSRALQSHNSGNFKLMPKQSFVIQRVFLSLFVLCCFVLPGRCQSSAQQIAAENRETLKISVFATIGSVNGLLTTQEGREIGLKHARACGASKIYVDLMRSGIWADFDNAVSIRKFFEENGIKVSAGITTSPEGKKKNPKDYSFGILNDQGNGYCWSHSETRASLRRVAEMAARGFDEVIVDDFFTFHCFCDACQRARGGRDWEEFHLARMRQVAKEDLVEVIRAINPDCNIIIKYPQWYDKFHEHGYDFVEHVHTFDSVFAGTETRDPNTLRFGFVQQTEGFINYSWIRSIAKEKMHGGWYDFGDITPDVFREQGYGSVLAGAQEIVLFNLYDICAESRTFESNDPKLSQEERERREAGRLNELETTNAFIDDAPNLFRLARTVKGKKRTGLQTYKPVAGRGSDGEYYLFDYLAMMGICVVMNSEAPVPGDVFLSLHSLKDPHLPQIVKEFDRAGTAGLSVSSSLLKAWSHEPELLAIFGYEPGDVEDAGLTCTVVRVDTNRAQLEMPIPVRTLLRPSHAEAVLMGYSDEGATPILTAYESPNGGQRCVLNMHTFSQQDFDAVGELFLAPAPHPFMKLPQFAVDAIRSHLEPSAPQISLPVRFGRYRYTDSLEVWVNYRDEPVSVAWDGDSVDYCAIDSGDERNVNGSLVVEPRRYVIVRSQ